MFGLNPLELLVIGAIAFAPIAAVVVIVALIASSKRRSQGGGGRGHAD